MLAGSVVRDWAPERYTEPDHPLQAVVGDTLAEYTGAPSSTSASTAAACPVHAFPLRRLATAYARLGARATAREEGPAALVEAVRHHPFMLAGTGQLDTLLLEATTAGILAKVGAEATYGAVDLSTATGLALKVLDGAPRARAAALLAALRALEWLTDAEWEAVIDSATVELHGAGHTVGTVTRPSSSSRPRTDRRAGRAACKSYTPRTTLASVREEERSCQRGWSSWVTLVATFASSGARRSCPCGSWPVRPGCRTPTCPRSSGGCASRRRGSSRTSPRRCGSAPRRCTCGPGILDEEAEPTDLEVGILRDPHLTERQKQVLIEVYRSFRARAPRRPCRAS
jgi:hypothetical protein